MHEPLARLLERTYSTAEREVIYRLLRGGGQVRHFAADPIPTETLQRILNATLDAPFLGGMLPWHLIVVTSPAVRARITAAVGEDRWADASLRPDGRGRAQFNARERLAEAPLHLAVTYERGGGPTRLERALDPTMDVLRTCRALQNLWLAAYAEGLGVEWVRPVDEGAVARLLALPPGCGSSPTSASACPEHCTGGPDEVQGIGTPKGGMSRASIPTSGGRQAGTLRLTRPRLTSPTAQHSRHRPEAESASWGRGG
jgi:5,6-dimethylbenzimidazole synthase